MVIGDPILVSASDTGTGGVVRANSPVFTGNVSQVPSSYGKRYDRIAKDIQALGNTGTITVTLTFDSNYGGGIVDIYATGVGASGAQCYAYNRRWIWYHGDGVLVTDNMGTTDAETGFAISYADAGSNKVTITITNSSEQTITGGLVVEAYGGGKDATGSCGFSLS